MRLASFVAALLCIAGLPALAGQTGCPTHYAAGDAPEITNQNLRAQVRELCYSAFGVVHSGVTRTALWSAERLTRASVGEAKELVRVNAFHEETRLPREERSELADFARSGYDRGHLAPSADQPNEQAQNESFSLANMVAQNPENNRNVWSWIETAVRTLAKQRGEIYVITGPIFRGANPRWLNARVLVPTHIYKVVYDPRRNEAAAYVVTNEATSDYSTVTVGELERWAGVRFFPALQTAPMKLALPRAVPYAEAHKRSANPIPSYVTGAGMHALRQILR